MQIVVFQIDVPSAVAREIQDNPRYESLEIGVQDPFFLEEDEPGYELYAGLSIEISLWLPVELDELEKTFRESIKEVELIRELMKEYALPEESWEKEVEND